MHRIDSANVETDKFGSGKDGFTDGDPGVTPATEVTDYWLDGVQEEICNVIEGNGGTLAKGTRTQLYSALRQPVGEDGDEAIDATGGTTSGTAIKALGGSPDGIGIESTGDGSGEGVKATGGDSSGTGLEGTGGATNGIGVEGIGTGAGEGVKGTGGSSSSPGLYGVGGTTDGNGVEGAGSGTGSGILGTGINGYGVVAESKTSSPAKAALRIVPQGNSLPATSPAKGDVCVFDDDGQMYLYNGNNWVPMIGQRYASVTDSSAVTAATETAFDEYYTIPLNTLRAGSTIRVRGWAQHTDDTGGGNAVLRVRIGGTSGQILALTASHLVVTDDGIIFDAVATIRTIGGSGTMVGHGLTVHGTSTVIVQHRGLISSSIATNADVDVVVTMDYASTGNSATLRQLVVDIS